MRQSLRWPVRLMLALLGFSATSGVRAQAVDARQTPFTSRFTNVDLIDSLVNISNAEFAVRTNIIALGPDTELPKGQLMQQDAALNVSQAKEELVRRGVSAMPDLLAHLDDARKTKATVKEMIALMYLLEYDSGPLGPELFPKVGGLSPAPRANRGPGGEYNFAVGDICFNIIGEIVDRKFQAVRYIPSAIVAINSPLLNPELRAAVRKEWTGLTVEQHRQSLIHNVTTSDPTNSHTVSGLKTLLRYYPDSAAPALRKRLEIPHYGMPETLSFMRSEIYSKEGTPEDRKKKIDELVANRGEGFRDSVVLQAWEDRNIKQGSQIVSGGVVAGQPVPPPRFHVVAPLEVLKELYPKFDADHPPVFNSIEVRDTLMMLRSLNELPRLPAEMTTVVWETYKKHANNHGAEWDLFSDEVAGTCIPLLANKGHNAEILAFCQRRKTEVTKLSIVATGNLQKWIGLVGDPQN